jgi:hypothetical protein
MFLSRFFKRQPRPEEMSAVDGMRLKLAQMKAAGVEIPTAPAERPVGNVVVKLGEDYAVNVLKQKGSGSNV